MAALVLCGAVVRFATLGDQSFDHDEAVTAWHVLHGDLGSTLHVVVSTERSPPLYYLLAWVWAQMFGTGEVGLRSLSALIGVATIPAAYLAAREFASRRAGVIAAAFVAFNPYLVWYSQEARSYALLVLFVAWGLYFFARCLDDPSRRNLALWAGASALALCSHYFAAFAVGAEGVWLAVRHWPRRGPLIAFLITVAVGLALLPLAIIQEGTGRRNLFTAIPLVNRAAGAVTAFLASAEPGGLSGSLIVRDFRGGVVIVGLGVASTALVLLISRATRRERRGAFSLGGVGMTALVAPFLLAAAGPDFVEVRNLIGALVPLLVAAAIALGCRRAGSLGLIGSGIAVSLFLAVLGGVSVSGQMQRPDWRGAAAALGPPTTRRVLVVARNGDAPIAYYRGALKFKPHRFPAVRVKEIDVISTLGTISPPGNGFRLTQRRGMAPWFTLWRFRAQRATLVRPDEVAGVLQEPASLLFEPARRSPSGR